MFERLNQPISFRRKPTAEDAPKAAAPAAEASSPAGAESQARERTSRFARLNQPISLRGRSKRREADQADAPPPQLAISQTRPAPAERPVAPPAPKSAPMLGSERVVAAPVSAGKSEPVVGSAERVVAAPVSAGKSEPVVGSAERVVATAASTDKSESVVGKRTSLFARLNKPISLRGKSKRQDADQTDAVPQPPAVSRTRPAGTERPVAASAADPGSAKRVIATPASAGKSEPAVESDRMSVTPASAGKSEPVAESERVTVTPTSAGKSEPERAATTPASAGKSEPVVGSAERATATSAPAVKPEPVVGSAERLFPSPQRPAVRQTPAAPVERVVPTPEPAAKSEPVAGSAERVVVPTPTPDPLVASAERAVRTPEPAVTDAENRAATSDQPAHPTAVPYGPRPGTPVPASTSAVAGLGAQASEPASVAPPAPAGTVTKTDAVSAPAPVEASSREAAAVALAAAAAADVVASRPSRLGRLNQPISLGRKSTADAAPATPDPAAAAPAKRERGSRLGRLNQPIGAGRKRAASAPPVAVAAPPATEAAPTPAAPPPLAAATPAKRGSRLARLNQPISVGGKSRGAPPSEGAPAAARRRGAHAPQRPRRTRNLVGLEIEPGQLVAARSHLDGQVVVERAVGTPLAPNIVRDGEVADVDALSSALSDLFDGSGLDRRVRIGIANQRIVMRQLELPPILDPKELANAVRFQAQDEIPMPIESVVLDFHALGIVETEAGARMRVLLVAARRDMVERVLLAARQAGLRPEGVDLAAFGMIRALRPTPTRCSTCRSADSPTLRSRAGRRASSRASSRPASTPSSPRWRAAPGFRSRMRGASSPR
jgi:hypothetical protein